jgi:hypothetical protein
MIALFVDYFLLKDFGLYVIIFIKVRVVITAAVVKPNRSTSYVPVMHCYKMAVTDMSFRQHAVFAFVVKEGKPAAVIYERLRGVCGDACVCSAVSECG